MVSVPNATFFTVVNDVFLTTSYSNMHAHLLPNVRKEKPNASSLARVLTLIREELGNDVD